MTPTAEEFLVKFRAALWGTAARPLVEMRQGLPSLEQVAESVRLAAVEALPGDFWAYFSAEAGQEELQRALLVLRQGLWPVERGDPTEMAAAVCSALAAQA